MSSNARDNCEVLRIDKNSTVFKLLNEFYWKVCAILSALFAVDIDETLVDNCGCEDNCTNKFMDRDNMTYECSCDDDGYELGADGHSCVGESIPVISDIS